MMVTIIKASFFKRKSKIISYRKYEHFPKDTFRDTLSKELSQVQASSNGDGFDNFSKFVKTLWIS